MVPAAFANFFLAAAGAGGAFTALVNIFFWRWCPRAFATVR
jgi:hypothetical protein